MMNVSASGRRQARHYAMQGLYQWQMAGSSLNAIEAEFRTDNDMSKVDVPYFQELLHQVPAKLDELEAAFAPYLQGRDLDELDPITQSLLRLSTYEMKHRIDVPYKVVINESVALAKKFGATDAHKFINAVLDQLAAHIRAVEVQAERNQKR